MTNALSCSSNTPTYLQHLKRPLALAPVFVSIKQCRPKNGAFGEEFCLEDKDCPTGKSCVAEGKQYFTYIANADIDRLTVVKTTAEDPQSAVFLRELLLDPRTDRPGILYIPTGRYPVDLAVSPDQKRLFVLHGIDGDLMVLDPRLQAPFRDKKGQPLRIPKNCHEKGTCWKTPKRLVLYQEAKGRQIYGFVALAGEKAVLALDMSEGTDFGHVFKRFDFEDSPSDLILNASTRSLYVTFATSGKVFRIDPKDLTIDKQSIDVGEPISTGSVASDDSLLFLISRKTGGIITFDLKKKKILPHGDQRLDDKKSLTLDGASFLSLQFIPSIYAAAVASDGQKKLVKGDYLWATASDGYGYLIDLKKRKIFDKDLMEPSTKNFRIYVDDDSFGDARNPIRATLPRIKTKDDDDSGVLLVADKVRSEYWSLVYEGELFAKQKGFFLKKGVFVSKRERNFDELHVQKGDRLILEECQPVSDDKKKIRCELPILKVEQKQLIVETKGIKLPTKDEWTFTVRTSKSYLVRGSLSGVQPERALEGKRYRNKYFELTIQAGEEPTPAKTKLNFFVDAHFSPYRVVLGGEPSRTTIAPARLVCSSADCESNTCKHHPICTKKKCQRRTTDAAKNQKARESGSLCNIDEQCNTKTGTCQPLVRLWILDASDGKLVVLNPDGDLLIRTTLR